MNQKQQITNIKHAKNEKKLFVPIPVPNIPLMLSCLTINEPEFSGPERLECPNEFNSLSPIQDITKPSSPPHTFFKALSDANTDDVMMIIINKIADFILIFLTFIFS